MAPGEGEFPAGEGNIFQIRLGWKTTERLSVQWTFWNRHMTVVKERRWSFEPEGFSEAVRVLTGRFERLLAKVVWEPTVWDRIREG